jgi:hypothetical protein
MTEVAPWCSEKFVIPQAESETRHLALIDIRTIPFTPQRTPILSYLSESAEYYANLLGGSAVIFKNGQ